MTREPLRPAKPGQTFGTCIACGQHIRVDTGATRCQQCAAWRRWFIAHRIASRYLREVKR